MKSFQLTDKEGLSLPRKTTLSTQEQALAWRTDVTEALMQAKFTCIWVFALAVKKKPQW